MTRSNSSTYARWVNLLDPATIDRFDRFGHECSTSRCTALPTHAYGWSYITGRSGRESSVEKLVCTNHGIKFAAKHDLTMGEARPQRTSMMDRVAADLATIGKHAGTRIRVRVHKSRHGSWYLGYRCVDESSLGESFWPMVGAHHTATLDESITTAETYLALCKQQVPAHEWERSAVDATATFTHAWLVQPWLNQAWSLTVTCHPDQRYDRPGMWKLTRELADRFQPITNDLGWNNMTLSRAIVVADQILAADGWSTTHPQWFEHATDEDTRIAHQLGWHPDQLRRVQAPQAQPC